MSHSFSSNSFSHAVRLGMAFAFLAGLSAAVPPAHARPAKVSYAPGISLVPEVVQSDGVTARTYPTANGTSLWTPGLPVQQGDKLKLNVFAATGGAELAQIRVRLDNTLLPGMPLVAAPWKTVLDTATLAPGYHMVEVWAQASGDKPQSTTKTLTFYVSKQLDAQFRVKPSLQQLQNGTTSALATSEEALSDTPPSVPEFLQGKETDGNAQVVVSARPDTTAGEFVSTNSTEAVSLAQPTLFVVQAAPGSTAVRFTYALVRGSTVTPAPQGYGLSGFRLRLQKKDANSVGLNPGTLALWVWGIDRDGRPSDPLRTTLNVPE